MTNLFILLILPLLCGWTADRLLGDPNTSLHPIILFGKAIAWGEKRLNAPPYQRQKGTLFNASLILLTLIVTFALDMLTIETISNEAIAQWVILPLLTLIIFFMLSGTTLIREVEGVFLALERSLEEGRRQVARIVGRDTESLSEQEVRTASLETLSENLSDGVIAPLFWYALLGTAGIVGYKMTNTQDSMIGYKHIRYRDYGCFSARLDDLLNYIPARLTAVLMLLSVGKLHLLPKVWQHGKRHASPNSGYPEAALALILGCRFGGSHNYFGQSVYKPYIGETERPLTYTDLRIAVRINRHSEYMMLGLTILLRLGLLYLLIG